MAGRTKWIAATAVVGLVGVGVTMLLRSGEPVAESEASDAVFPGLVPQEVAGLRLVSPGPLVPTEDAAYIADSTIVDRDLFTATGFGVILTVTHVRYEEGSAPFLDDAVTRAVAAVRQAVARPDGSDAFEYRATRVGVSGRYAIRIRATYNEPVANLEQWTEALFFQEFDDLWQVQVVGSSGEVPEAGRVSADILDSVEMTS